MLNLSRTKLIVISGAIWFVIGSFLLYKGLNFLIDDTAANAMLGKDLPLLSLISPYIGSVEQAALIMVALALLVGFMKGKTVLAKAAGRIINRIYSLPNPVSITRIYDAKYYVIIGLMVGMGMSMNFLGMPTDIRGFIDVAIGSALIKGSMFYFRSLSEKKAA